VSPMSTIVPAEAAVNPRRRRFAAPVATVVLAAIALGAAARDPVGLSRFVLGFAYRGVAVDVPRWQEWADSNAPFFGPLAPGARFAYVEDIADSTGVVFTRTEGGMRVEKTHFLRFRRVPLVLAAPPPVAAEIQTLRMARDGNRFWDGLKNLSRRRVMKFYRFGDRAQAQQLGMEAFLRTIDVFDPEAPRPTH